MTRLLLIASALALVVCGSAVPAVFAQDVPASIDLPPGNPSAIPNTVDEAATSEATVPVDQPPQVPSQAEATWTITVQLQHAEDSDADLSGLPVFLHALRSRGPFESGTPEPTRTWSSVTNNQGLASFSIEESVGLSGLRLQAHTTFGGVSFQSPPTRPADGLQIETKLYDLGHDISGLRVLQKRVVVEPWEEYLIISQFWTLMLPGDRAVDLGLSPDPNLQRGLPIRLPLEAEGIHFSGPGDHEIINNFVYWKGVLQPNAPISFQIRFSQPVRTSETTFRQTMAYPVDEVQVIAPIQTQYQKIPRLEDLTLVAPGFHVSSDAGQLGLRSDMDFLVATGRSLNAGEEYAFRIEGLPFKRPTGGWIALIGGLLGALIIFVFGRKEFQSLKAERTREKLLKALKSQHQALLDELHSLHEELGRDDLDDVLLGELEEEEALLRERLALILRRIRDLEQD